MVTTIVVCTPSSYTRQCTRERTAQPNENARRSRSTSCCAVVTRSTSVCAYGDSAAIAYTRRFEFSPTLAAGMKRDHGQQLNELFSQQVDFCGAAPDVSSSVCCPDFLPDVYYINMSNGHTRVSI
ncbi:unnamed protein product, partial [Iphiclides podalirius]